MTKNEALKLLAGNRPLDDLLLKQIREAITDGVSSPETDEAVLAKYGTVEVEPIVVGSIPVGDEQESDDDDEYYESSESYEDEWESSEC